jgi:hypothetical protein
MNLGEAGTARGFPSSIAFTTDVAGQRRLRVRFYVNFDFSALMDNRTHGIQARETYPFAQPLQGKNGLGERASGAGGAGRRVYSGWQPQRRRPARLYSLDLPRRP